MKKKTNHHGCTKHVLALLLFIFLHHGTSKAAIVPATVAESTLATGVTPEQINADMVRCPLISGGTNYLSAFAYGDGNTLSVNVSVVFPGSPQLNFSIPNAVQPDIIIADDYLNPGQDYLLCVVYNDYTTGWLDVYRISGIGTGTMSQTLVYQVALPPKAPSAIKYPHIDGFTDPNRPIGGVPSIHEFVVVWTGSTNADAQYRDVDPTVGTSGLINSISTLATSQSTDVAVATDMNTSTKYAFFFYLDFTAAVGLEEWDVSGTITSITTLTMPASSTNTNLWPHIEAMSLYDPGAGWVKWQAIAGHLVSGTWNIYGYNDLSTTAVGLSTGIIGSSSQYAAVAAGIGQFGSATDTGNVQYTAAWYDNGNTTNYAKYVDASSNTLSIDEYEVNCSGCTPVRGRAGQPIAVTNSSNDGYDILAAWYDGTNIVYKKTTNLRSYKPTSILHGAKDEAQIQVYPNPSANVLHIANVSRGQYSITDMSGRKVMTGELTENGINVDKLNNGYYNITVVTDKGLTKSLAFSKK